MFVLVLMGAAMTNREDLDQHLLFMQLGVGAVPSPFDCYLANRGAKTLHLRMKAHSENGMAVAKWLEQNPRVEKVLYPELESHPQYHIHKKQTTGMSGMISFYLLGGLQESQDFLSSLKVRSPQSVIECANDVFSDLYACRIFGRIRISCRVAFENDPCLGST